MSVRRGVLSHGCLGVDNQYPGALPVFSSESVSDVKDRRVQEIVFVVIDNITWMTLTSRQRIFTLKIK